ncbi:Spo0E family sporulation regulatory protein-aspartic acid phosphatase [Bacillus thuringiensis serovar iberica]|uniref:Spo0E family sporulation regulatory protein-aspartic acid phosphatase n=1 Tax=Bacillus thuringiensis serovar iberica TaxID=180866 RepID=A0A9X6LI65_BACTU|nr:aspartyl-phosphate phosphatase Spo0E family protein [Bacillus thuringiensis]MEB9620246.1 aspartyl-phosphate phosphatase Spo0E family protein [Bacillus cereus]OUB46410.1 Spo0E family sporulation regulatory protein-aspartic acid phosphatase [Bacillus thuringiensis serovar iberica]
MSTSDILLLQKQIEEKKKQLRQLVKVYGYTDPIVLACRPHDTISGKLYAKDYKPLSLQYFFKMSICS